MKRLKLIPGVLCMVAALCLMFALMTYAPFYAPSYFFWIGVILALTGIVSLLWPLSFLFVFNRRIAAVVAGCGVLLMVASLYWPVPVFHAASDRELDALLPEYSFCEYHQVLVDASPGAVKQALKTVAVSDVPVIHFLTKVRGIDDKRAVRFAGKNSERTDTFATPDFNFFVVDSTEMVTVMLLHVSFSGTAPRVKTFEEFRAFRKPGYIKVAINFRFIDQGNGHTLVSTETRNAALTRDDARVFARYWRIIYPGSAIIRRAWLEALARKAEKV